MTSHLERYAASDSPVHRIDARAKLVAFMSLLLCIVTTPPDAYAVFAGYAGVVIAVGLTARLPLRFMAGRMALVLPFVLAVTALAPFLTPDDPAHTYALGVASLEVTRAGLMVLWNALIKALLGVLSLSVLTATTPISELLAACERLRVPRVLLTLAGLTYRYLFVVVEEARRMKRAADARGYAGRWLWHASSVGHLAGMLFLRSYERAERVHLAMIARGFTGHFPSRPGQALRPADYAFAGVLLTLAGALRWGAA